MPRVLILLGFACFLLQQFCAAQQAQDENVLSAAGYLKQHFGEVLCHEQQAFALSIGAPEIIRYHYFRNFLETASLELLYVEQGSEVIDFSIGPFQMKPSFVEKLEKKIFFLDLAGDLCRLAEYNKGNPRQIRQERLRRMQQAAYQEAYLRAFRAYCERHYADYLCDKTTEEQLGFMATVYNLGFDQEVHTVLAYAKEENFPYGRDYSGPQYAYGQLAISIYQQIRQ
ncbi:MAG: hypothetical protein ACLFOZ_18445 [Cyclobacteriaceae bacterium]